MGKKLELDVGSELAALETLKTPEWVNAMTTGNYVKRDLRFWCARGLKDPWPSDANKGGKYDG